MIDVKNASNNGMNCLNGSYPLTLAKTETSMIQQIEKLKEIINQNSMGHLPLPYRVDLMKQIGNSRTVQKVLCECCKKACSSFPEEFCAENLLVEVLSEIDSYLYKNKGTAESILVSVERLRNYVEQSADSLEGMASWAIISLGYAIRYDAASILAIEDYDSEDDDAFDFESWNADFICSIACSGSNPFVETGNVEKRKEYWLWYVKMVLEVSQNPNLKYLSLPVFKSPTPLIDIPVRHQSDNTIEAQFKDILSYIMDCEPQKFKEGLEYDILFVSTVVDMFSITSSDGDRITLNTKNCDKICNTLRDIRKRMYQKDPKQGAWFQVEIFLKNKEQYTFNFNYDNLEQLPSFFQEPDWLLGMFKKFPRSKEYTPLWLREIVGRRKLYLA